MFLHILGFIIDDYSSALIDVNVDEFDKIETLFFKHNSKYYNKNELEKWHRLRPAAPPPWPPWCPWRFLRCSPHPALFSPWG